MSDSKIRSVLITGVSGSGGSYLAEYVANHCKGVAVHGISRWHSTTSEEDNLFNIRDQVKVHECDLNDFSSVLQTLKDVKPDGIFHLAAHANVRAGFITPLAVLQNNIMGTANLFEAIRAAGIDPIIQLCSTSEVYGQVAREDVPIRETLMMNPVSPYAVSKCAQDHLGGAYFKSYGMKIIRTRMFAYLNPRRRDLFATSFARQVALVEAGKQKELKHGNLDSVRTLIDVRDAMEAYWYALVKGVPGEIYNMGGETTMTVGEFLDILKKLAKTKIPTVADPALFRPADVTLQIPDTSKFRNQTGWKPKFSIEESIAFLLDHWRNRIQSGLSS